MNSYFLVDEQRKNIFKINNKLLLKNHRKIFYGDVYFLSG